MRGSSRPSPVRPYNRFMSVKVDGSGRDAMAIFKNFAKKNESTIDAFRDNKMGTVVLKREASLPIGKVPHGTTKCTYKLGLDTTGKLERGRLGVETRLFPKNPTDIVSQEPPESKRPFQGLYDQMVRVPKYETNNARSKPWAPQDAYGVVVQNRGSVSHNIITNEPNRYSAVLSPALMQEKSHGRLKGITEVQDLARLTVVRSNPNHSSQLSESKKAFARKDGMFTHLYNSAARFGESKPFKA